MSKMNLTELEKDSKNISKETGTLLSMLSKGSVLEIGTNHGYSTYWLSKNAKEVITYEIIKERAEQAKINLKDIKHIKVINKNFLEEYIEKQFDFIFIDATKREYLDYFKKCEKLIKKGGIIACDNVISHKEKMQNFLNYIENFQSVTLNLGKGILLIQF